MAIVRKRIIIYEGDTPTPEQIEKLKALENRPIVYDEDCPEESYEHMVEMYEKSKEWREERKRKRMMQTRQPLPFSMNVLPSTVRAAEKYGEAVMSRLLDLAVQDEAMIQKCL